MTCMGILLQRDLCGILQAQIFSQKEEEVVKTDVSISVLLLSHCCNGLS